MLLSVFFLPSPGNLVVSFSCLEVYCPEKVQFFLLWYSCITKCQGSHYSGKTWKIRGKSGKDKKSGETWKTRGNFLENQSTQLKLRENFRLLFNLILWRCLVHNLVIFGHIYTFFYISKILAQKSSWDNIFSVKKNLSNNQGKIYTFFIWT